ncbi:hypothetical protein H6G36_14555 [Anabaena minutissima FACHB-250]|nr:hypothetical protein [Anabaena minutissima FACHB-250]
MTPHCPQPFYIGLIGAIASNALEVVYNIVASHLAESPQQITRVIEHDTGIATLIYQFGNKIPHAAVTISKRCGVVVVPFLGMFKHILQITDEFTIMTSRDRRLVHM